MKIELQFKSLPNKNLPIRIYDPELDDVRSIFIDVCHFVDGLGELIVSGFGQEHWPVDVRTDLSILLEQLPDMLYAINLNQDTELDFYEQGIQRTIIFSLAVNSYVTTCVSQTEWRPSIEYETIDRNCLKEMLLRVKEEFLRLVRHIAPELLQHPWMLFWIEQVS